MNAQIKKTVSVKMSQSGKVDKKTPAPKAPKNAKPSRAGGRKVLYVLLWLFFGLLVMGCVLLALAWYFRMDLAKNTLQSLIAKQGYEAEFNLSKLSQTQAIATDISFRKDSDLIFTANKLVVDYDWNKRAAQKIVVDTPNAHIKFNTRGQIVSKWWPQKSSGGNSLLMPPEGLFLKDGVLNWRLQDAADTSVIGSGQSNITAEIMSPTHFTASLSNTEIDNNSQRKTTFDSPTLRGLFTYNIFIATKDGTDYDLYGSVLAKDLDTTLLPVNPIRTDELTANFKLHITRPDPNTQPEISGMISADILGLGLEDYNTARTQIKFTDIVYAPSKNIMSANWRAGINGLQISNQDMRTTLADTLTSHTRLSTTPIAKYFTKPLYQKADKLLQGFDVDGHGTYQSTHSDYVVSLNAPLHIEANKGLEKQSVVFTTSPASGFIRYDKQAAQMHVASEIDWTGERALNMSGFSMIAKSKTGITLDGLDNLSAHIKSAQEWHTPPSQQNAEALRLAPIDFKFSYANHGPNKQVIKMRGGLDYDGPVPGGSVIGLKTAGDVRLDLRGENFAMGYNPATPISLDSFDNASGWTAKSVSFSLAPEDKLLAKSGNVRPMQMKLSHVSANIVGPQNARHLDTTFDSLTIHTDFSTIPQHWNILAHGSKITSEDFPAPGTRIVSATSELNVYQTQAGDMTFDLHSPDTTVTTHNAAIKNLDIGLKGSPDDIALDYNAGSVAMVGGAVPVLPMHGTARLKSGELSGHAITNLPRTKDTPIDIHYRSKDGQGSAKILIPKIVFDPYGLQPQHLVSILRGKLADVSGEISAEFDFEFGGGLPVRSKGTTDLIGLNIGTLVGPLSGVNSKLKFTSIFPLKSEGVQTATLAGFDPGFPLKDGTIQFEIIPDGVKLLQAIWPISNTQTNMGTGEMLDGSISILPTVWRFGDVENRVTAKIENVNLGAMLASVGKDKLSATGQVTGTLPARINGVNVVIDEGLLTVKDGGIIRYKSAATDNAGTSNEAAGHAFKALENFTYRQLEARINGPLDGEMALKILFDGHNPEVLAGQTFQFNTVITGELANIMRNMTGAFSNEQNLSRIMEIQNGERDSENEP